MVKNIQMLKAATFFDDRDAGERVDRILQTLMTELRTKIQFAQPHALRLTKADQAIDTGVGNAEVLEWDSEDFDYGDMFDASVSANNITITERGLYHIEVAIAWSSGFAEGTFAELDIRVGGSVVMADIMAGDGSAAIPRTQKVSTLVELGVGDVVDVRSVHTAGSPRTVNGADNTTHLVLYQVNPQR